MSRYAEGVKVGCVMVEGGVEEGVCMGWKGSGGGGGNVCEKEVEGEVVWVGVMEGEENGVRKVGEEREECCGVVMFVSDSGWGEWRGGIMESGKMGKVLYEGGYGMIEGIIEMVGGGIEVYGMVDEIVVVEDCVKKGEVVWRGVLVKGEK